MKISKSSLVLTAAMTGLLGGTIARAAAPMQDSSHQDSKPAKTKVEKHACAGKNSCKGKGGCKTGDNGCKGKNSCKGKGGCATDGSKKNDTRIIVFVAAVARAPPRSASPPQHFPIQCLPIDSTDSPITASASACASRIYQHILEQKPVVDWFEIISENYMVDGGRPLAILDQILEQYRVVQHGVSMYFGSAEPLNREHCAA